ncbi:MAG: hypothetical protein QXP07_01890, partial [Candidatus Parvarchaeum sp.]|nr:hypothetical protein [Candidatus Parvarchaeum tengchongense]
YVILKKVPSLDYKKLNLLLNQKSKTLAFEQIKKKIELIQPVWNQEISQLTGNFVDFETAKKYTESALSTLFT